MEKILESDFFKYAPDGLKNTLNKTVLKTIEKTNSKKGDFGEGATKYTFDNSDIIIVVFYSYTMISDTEYKGKYEIYNGTEMNDFILDKLNEFKKRAELRGEKWVWE